eukprot:4859828-Amphidinium_carterae.1
MSLHRKKSAPELNSVLLAIYVIVFVLLRTQDRQTKVNENDRQTRVNAANSNANCSQFKDLVIGIAEDCKRY